MVCHPPPHSNGLGSTLSAHVQLVFLTATSPTPLLAPEPRRDRLLSWLHRRNMRALFLVVLALMACVASGFGELPLFSRVVAFWFCGLFQ